MKEHRVSKFLVAYLIFTLFFMLVNICLISVVSCFHFMLDHNIGIIEDWLYGHAWEILITAKLIALYLYTSFFSFCQFEKHQFLNLKAMLAGNRLSYGIGIFYSYAVILLLNRGLFENPLGNINYPLQLICILGLFTLFGSDAFVVGQLYRKYLQGYVQGWRRFFFLLLAAALFSISSKLMMPYQGSFLGFYFAFGFICFFLEALGKNEFLGGSIPFIILVIGGFSFFLGINPVFYGKFSLWKSPENIWWFAVFVSQLPLIYFWKRRLSFLV